VKWTVFASGEHLVDRAAVKVHMLTEVEIETLSPMRLPGVGRNDPCPCCSGKKYKKWHGATAEV